MLAPSLVIGIQSKLIVQPSNVSPHRDILLAKNRLHTVNNSSGSSDVISLECLFGGNRRMSDEACRANSEAKELQTF